MIRFGDNYNVENIFTDSYHVEYSIFFLKNNKRKGGSYDIIHD